MNEQRQTVCQRLAELLEGYAKDWRNDQDEYWPGLIEELEDNSLPGGTAVHVDHALDLVRKHGFLNKILLHTTGSCRVVGSPAVVVYSYPDRLRKLVVRPTFEGGIRLSVKGIDDLEEAGMKETFLKALCAEYNPKKA